MGFAPVIEKERRREPRFSYDPGTPAVAPVDWVRIAACGSLIVGGCLLLAGKKRAGTVVATSGTALALLDQEDTLRRLWAAMPGYLDQAQRIIDQVQEVMDDISEKGESLRRALARERSKLSTEADLPD